LKKHLHDGAMAGQISGMINGVESTAAIVERLVKDAGAVMEKVAAQLK
jgi:NAD(P)H-dependent flavin oxidoreductase YrpB (nitropropane dioxygenase family)